MDLTRIPAGWAEPLPLVHACGSDRRIVGRAWFGCAGARHGGHRSWRCRACDRVRTLGCVGPVEVMSEYGGR